MQKLILRKIFLHTQDPWRQAGFTKGELVLFISTLNKTYSRSSEDQMSWGWCIVLSHTGHTRLAREKLRVHLHDKQGLILGQVLHLKTRYATELQAKGTYMSSIGQSPAQRLGQIKVRTGQHQCSSRPHRFYEGDCHLLILSNSSAAHLQSRKDPSVIFCKSVNHQCHSLHQASHRGLSSISPAILFASYYQRRMHNARISFLLH